MDPANAKPVNKTPMLPFTTTTEGNATKSSIHQTKTPGKKVSKTERSSIKSSCVSPASKDRLNSFKLQEPISKGNMDSSSSTKNLFTNFSMHQSLNSNPMLQGLSGNCDKTWPDSMFHGIDTATETPTTTSFSLTKGISSTSSISSSPITQEDKTKSPCNVCDTTKETCACNNNSTSSTSMFTNNDVNTNTSNFFKTANSTTYVTQQSTSLIISSPFKHLMVGPKISNMPTPFNGPLNNSNPNTTSSQEQTPVTNVNQETNCKILFPLGKGENLCTGSPPADQAATMQTNNNSESVPGILNSIATSSRHKSRRARYATMDPEQLALIRQRKRDRKFRKLQSLSPLMRAPDDRHSMGPLTALKREIVPNTLLRLSNHNLSPKLSSLTSNPFCQPSITGGNQLNRYSLNNPWKGENTKKPCSFIHEPSLKNGAILSQNPLELPMRRFDYQKNMNSSNDNFGASNMWKSLGSREITKEFRSSSSSSTGIEGALRNAARKFIKNDVKDKESATQKDATPISTEIFGSNKTKTPNFFLPSSTGDENYLESAPSSSGEDNTKEKSPNKKAAPWSGEDKSSRNIHKPAARRVVKVKSRKRTSSSKRRIHANGTSSMHNRSLTNDLKRPAENQSDESPSVKETDKVYSESKRSRISVGTKEKRLLVNTKRRGRPPIPGKLKVFKSIKRRGRPPVIGPFKPKLQLEAVNSQKVKCKVESPSSPNLPKRRGRPPKNPDAPPIKIEIPKLTDEELLKVKLNVPRRRGRPSKAEAMLREMAVAHLAATGKEVNIGLGLTNKPRPARKQSFASRQHYHCPEPPGSVEDVGSGSYGTKKIKSEPVSLEESTSGEGGRDAKISAANLKKNIKVESTTEISESNLARTTLSAFDNKGQRKRKPFKKFVRLKTDPDYIKRKFGFNRAANKEAATSAVSMKKGDTAEDENEEVPANRSRPLLLRNVKKNSKPLPTFTDSDESDVEESNDVEYPTPKQRTVPIVKFKPPIKICRPLNTSFTAQQLPPIYNVPRVLLPPSIKDTGIPCKMCGKVHTRDHFFKYMELKTTDQPHRCPLCGQYFTWSCLFIEHMRSHPENTAQYRCEYCNAVSRKISAYFNCRITHCPPSKEWLNLQKTCDEYLAVLNEAKEKKSARYTKMIAQRIEKPIGNTVGTLSKNYLFNTSNLNHKTGRPPKITPMKTIKLEVSSSTTVAKDYAVNLNEAKDKKTGKCSKVIPNKVIKQEAPNPTTAEKVQAGVGKTKSRGSGRKNPASKKPFECKVCQKTFLTFDFLTKHKQLHKSKRPYSCKTCGKRFSTQSYLTVHRRTYHSDSGEKSLKCEVCNLTFSYLIAYNIHMSRFGHLPEEEHRMRSVNPHVCDICQRGFKNKPSLINHMRTHTGERPYICEVCNHSFTQTASLERHRRIHQQNSREKPRRQEKRYSCKPCKKNFTYETTYNNHMQTHVEGSRYYCDICDKNYATAQLLKGHRHNEQRPYKCKTCGRCYKLKHTLIEHKRVCGL